jgi:hypothetical protein
MLTHEQRLALAVLALAAEDATTLDPTRYAAPTAQQLARDRQATARAFLTGGPMLPFWCSLAGLDPQTVATTAQQRFPGKPANPPVCNPHLRSSDCV